MIGAKRAPLYKLVDGKPQQVQVRIGASDGTNTEISLMMEPSITTINQPRYEIGSYACDLLLEQIKNPKAPARHLLLNTELIARESTMR